jgi:hypothetical protein
MNEKEKEKFLTELIDDVKKDLINESAKYPEEWDGIELRWRVKEVFAKVVFGGYTDKRSTRYRDYENYVLTNNLI